MEHSADKLSYEDLLKYIQDLYEDLSELMEELKMKKEGGEDMELPEELDINSPENVGKMIPQAGYGSLGKINISISMGGED
jgi:hypothetical protein